MANRIKRLRLEKARQEKEALFRKLLAEQKHKAKKIKLTPTVARQLEAVNYRFDAVSGPLKKKRVEYLCKAFQKFIESPKGRKKDLYQDVPKEIILKEILEHKGLRKIIDHRLFRAVQNVIHSCEIVRPISNWKAPNTNDVYQLCWSFFEHCCIRYPEQMPYCLKRTYFYDGVHYLSTYDEEQRDWICKYYEMNLVYHFAQGKGLHNFEDNFSYTGRMNFYFHNLPRFIEYPDLGIRWAALAAWGIPAEHIKGLILNWPRGQVLKSEPMFRFLARHKTLSIESMKRIMSFYQSQRFGHEWIYGKEIEPLFPGFTFSKRTLKSVMRHVERWEKWLRLQKEVILSSPLVLSEKKNFQFGNCRIEQLTTAKAIVEEGDAMHHCVAEEYLSCCIEGTLSIWSIWETVEGTDDTKRLATLSVTNENKVQEYRAKYNMDPAQRATKVVLKWTQQEGIEYDEKQLR